MARIQLVQTQDKDVNQLQRNIAKVVEPIANNPITDGLLLTDVVLASGDNTVDHKLGRTLQGWLPVRRQGSYTDLYDKQNTNTIPDKTLILNSSGATTINLYVF